MHGVGDHPAIATRGLGVSYGALRALDGVTVEIWPGELVALAGPNGAGKTTFLHALLGLVPYDGEVAVHARRRGPATAFVPQRVGVDVDFPITVEQVVAAGRRARLGRWPRIGPADREAVARAHALVGLDGLERRALGELSGGQQRRAFIARALAQEADVLLLDEPFTGVDARTADGLVDLLAGLAAAGHAIVVVTHDAPLVRRAFPRCLLLDRTLRADGPPAELLAELLPA